VATPNIFEPEFGDDWEGHGFFRRYARIAADLNAERLGATLMEMPAGTTPVPYHLHYGNEEMLIVVAGTPSVRTPAGWRELAPGDVVSFRAGPEGAHQVSNFSDEAARVLMISTRSDPDVLQYPDSGKTAAKAGPTGPNDPGLWESHFSDAAVDYWEGEEPPSSDA
jgi:uncharacterized cupin superfamily protein